ncbi:hypothetical protein ACLI09_07635 [Flavobacterium sp. RHBU_24]|uniref:hypothetical protein n=1 Tax=Flavobacterium sp. RHBU_24 TaxID=3391185 RepID=UPI0039854086
MTRYESIISLGDNFIKLISKGLIPTHVLDWKVYYEAYLKEMDILQKQHGKPKKTRACGHVADDYKISERCMFSIIAFMEGC